MIKPGKRANALVEHLKNRKSTPFRRLVCWLKRKGEGNPGSDLGPLSIPDSMAGWSAAMKLRMEKE
jgi:hypothetical protein